MPRLAGRTLPPPPNAALRCRPPRASRPRASPRAPPTPPARTTAPHQVGGPYSSVESLEQERGEDTGVGDNESTHTVVSSHAPPTWRT